MITLTGKEFKAQYRSPIVYAWMRDSEYLYVGKCYYGVDRLAYDKLHDILKSDRIQDTDTIEIYYFESNEDCLAYERYMIKEHTPKFNFKQGPKVKGDKDKAVTLFMEFGGK